MSAWYHENMKEKKSAVILAVVAVVVFLCSCVTIAGLLAWAVYLREKNSDTPTDVYTNNVTEYDDDDDYDYGNETDTPSSDEEEDEPVTQTPTNLGTITGQVTYPSEYIPDGMTICAENVTSGETLCTTEIEMDTSGTNNPPGNTAPYYSYTLEIPAGNYYIYAYDADGDPEYKAYYSKFVTCGLSVECESHDIIIVTISNGDNLTGIDPGDWYAP